MSAASFRSRPGHDSPVFMSVTANVEVPLSVRDLAEAFCQFSADEQAEFFADVNRIMQSWNYGGGPMQRHYIGKAMQGDDMAGAREWLHDLFNDVIAEDE